MRKSFTAAVAIIGACALIGSLLTNALASKPAPLRGLARAQDKKFAVNGSLNVTGVLKVNKNVNIVTGKLYAHNGAQIWKRLTISGGGLIVTPALQVTGPSAALFSGGATIAGNVSTGALSVNGALSTTGAASIGGKLTSIGGVDAGTGGITTSGIINTSGDINAKDLALTGTLTVPTLTIANFSPQAITTGSISAATLTTSGTAAVGGNATVGGTLTTNSDATIGGTLRTGTITSTSTSGTVNFTGNVNFSGATVTGLSGVGTSGNPVSLTVGASTATTSPLTISENNHAATIGVDTNGNMVFSSNLISSALSAPITSGTTQGTLSLTGNGINLTGATTLTSGSDLFFSIPGSGSAGHLVANGDSDLAGVTSAISVTSGTQPSGGYTVSKTFTKTFSTTPVVVVTPTSDPEPTPGQSPRIWVNTSTTGFTVHLVPEETAVTTPYSVSFYYEVMGG